MFSFFCRRRITAMMLAFSAAANASIAARADNPGDYSHVIPITVSGKQAVVQLPLPRTVYLEARSKDLHDLRLFDSTGAPMPFAMIERVGKEQVSRSTAMAAVFPVRAPAGARQGLPEGLQIHTGDEGTLISVTTPSAHSAADELASLVLDIRAPRKAENSNEIVAVSALSLSLPRAVDNYNARLVLETSDDLQHWVPLTEASVSWLVNSHGAEVRNNRIEFAPRQFRYARIGWLEGKPIEFGEIIAELVTSVRTSQQWESLVLPGTPGKTRDDLIYTAPPAIPVQAVGVVFHAQNAVLPALIGQYHEQPGPASVSDLRTLTGATFYQLTQNGQQRVSGDVEVPVTHAIRWVLRPQAKLPDRPDLRLLWKPATMVFIAGGKGPYALAFGRDGAQPGDQPLAQVAPGFSSSELAALELATAGAPVRQHAREAVGAPDGLTGLFHRREFWLWGLLLCGVATLALMAWRLMGQLKDESSNQPKA